MVVDLGRVGKKAGKGFYDYPEDGKKRIWPGLEDLVGSNKSTEDVDVEELKKRFLYIQALEASRCFEEEVVTDVRDADVGAILGWGFAPWAGGPLSLIDMVGADNFVKECEAGAQKWPYCFLRFRGTVILPAAFVVQTVTRNVAFRASKERRRATKPRFPQGKQRKWEKTNADDEQNSSFDSGPRLCRERGDAGLCG
jgi:3-hydroxyacyl-CoA dehydrogenase